MSGGEESRGGGEWRGGEWRGGEVSGGGLLVQHSSCGSLPFLCNAAFSVSVAVLVGAAHLTKCPTLGD